MSHSRRQLLFQSAHGAALMHSSLRNSPATPPAPRSRLDGKTLARWRAMPRPIVPPGSPFAAVPAERLTEAVLKWHAESPALRGRLTHLGHWRVEAGAIASDRAPDLRWANLREGRRDPRLKTPPLTHAATFAEFAGVWRPNDWTHSRIHGVARLPVITTWVNGEEICELDTAKITTLSHDLEAVLARFGRAGHLAFKVHDGGPKDLLGPNRWATGAVCRWRNLMITER